MIRKACVMMLKPGCEAEYKKRHDELWPDMVEMLKAHGGHNYSIFLHPQTLQLFAYVEIESEEKWQATATTDTCQRWCNTWQILWKQMRMLHRILTILHRFSILINFVDKGRDIPISIFNYREQNNDTNDSDIFKRCREIRNRQSERNG